MLRNDIILLAGGHSVSSYNLKGLHNRGTVIGVNDAFLKFKHCFAGITMDRAWMEARADQVLIKNKTFFVRTAAVKFIKDKMNSPNIRLYECNETHEMSNDPETLNGTSSGMCALNLALQLEPENIYLLGFDMQGGRWYDYNFKNWEPKGDKFRKWINQFSDIAKTAKTRIININHKSALKCFPVMRYEEFINGK